MKREFSFIVEGTEKKNLIEIFLLKGEMMKKKIFDSYCKKVLKNEAFDCFRKIQRHRKNEVFFSDLTEEELEQLKMEDEYNLDSYKYQVLGFDVIVKDTLLSEALNLLSDTKREVVLMAYFFDMSDTEISKYMNLRQSTIHYHRTSSLEKIKKYLEGKNNGK